jgi:hypothetical protein
MPTFQHTGQGGRRTDADWCSDGDVVGNGSLPENAPVTLWVSSRGTQDPHSLYQRSLSLVSTAEVTGTEAAGAKSAMELRMARSSNRWSTAGGRNRVLWA